MKQNSKAIYDIRGDNNLDRLLRESRDLGLQSRIAKVTPAYGSHEWWAALEARNQVQALSGTITSVFLSGHGDFPEFEMDSDGVRYTFERKGDENRYHVREQIRVQVAARSDVFKDESLDGFVVLRVEALTNGELG